MTDFAEIQRVAEEKWATEVMDCARVGLSYAGPLGLWGQAIKKDHTFKMGVCTGNDTWRSARFPEELKTKFKGQATVSEAFAHSVKESAAHPAMGWREITAVHIEGEKKFEKFTLSDYKWITYAEAKERADHFGAGLAALGMVKGRNISIYADSSKEWQISAQACFARGYPVATVYASLGGDALQYGLEQTEVTHIITDAALVPTVAAILDRLPLLTHIIFTPDPRPAREGGHKSDEQVAALVTKEGVTAIPWASVVELGAKQTSSPDDDPPKPEDVAVIMYTSGSTGTPKGVVLSHMNFVAAMAGISDGTPGIGPEDFFLSYLPLAHILALVADNVILGLGAAIGYGGARTLTDKSPAVHTPTCRGDANALRPTILAAVPTIMDRIRDAVHHAVEQKGGISKKLFDRGFYIKETYGSSAFYDWLVFDRLRTTLLGGRVRMIISGGGPLSMETQKFMNIVLCCPIGQGYGLTESTGAATIIWATDPTYGRVGPPISCCEIKLVAWEEGGYLPTDKPHPRGEVLLHGANIAQGYYKLPDQTAESFKADADGKMWFLTGDIGEIHEDGVLQIIDRKKDLVKNQNGEYVSYGKIEPMLKDCPLIDHVMLYQDPLRNLPVALVTCETKKEPPTPKAVLEAWQGIAKAKKLTKAEVPVAVFVCPEGWTPDNDMATAALKLKRNNIVKHYRKELDALYASAPN